MFTSITVVESQPGRRAELTAVCQDTIAPTLAEPGCRGVRLYEDVENDRRLVFIGDWDSEEAWQQHMGTPRQKELADWAASGEGQTIMASWSAQKLREATPASNVDTGAISDQSAPQMGRVGSSR